jgi:NAD(P)-dependent dehydrogenase (short-subunit alcohol dehydrogenase family)
MNWNDKVVIITGAGTGIGKATKDLLRNKGAVVYNLDLALYPGDLPAHYVTCDVRDKASVSAAVNIVFEREKKIDMLFANAGIHLFAGIEETTDAEFDNVIATNISGTFYTLKSVLPFMKANNRGSIVLMGSDQSFVGKSRSAVYGLTKAAISQLAKSTAIDYAPFNIRVNCICPGTIDTPLLHKAVDRFVSLTASNSDEVYESLDKSQPAGRVGKPEEIAAVVAFLLSDENSFMTGSLVSADGGYVCQ